MSSGFPLSVVEVLMQTQSFITLFSPIALTNIRWERGKLGAEEAV